MGTLSPIEDEFAQINTIMEKEKIFVGFSTAGNSQNRSWALYDIELIKKDLLNHFHTRKGERVMRPTFGCSIWELINEQMTDGVVEQCKTEVERIVSLDSRVVVRDVYVDTMEHGILVMADLYYRPFDIVDRFRISFESRQ